MADTKTSRRSKRSPLVAKRTTTSGGDMSGATTSSSTSSGSTSTTRHRSNTSEGISVTSAAASDGHQSQDDSETVSINILNIKFFNCFYFFDNVFGCKRNSANIIDMCGKHRHSHATLVNFFPLMSYEGIYPIL